MDGRAVARRHGQGRRRDRDPVHQRAGRVLWQLRRGAQAGARDQRLRRAADRRSPRPLRHVRDRAATRCRRDVARDRIRPRYAEDGRHLHDDRLSGQVPGRSCLQAGDGGAQPAQGCGLYPSVPQRLLPQPGAGRVRATDRARHRHHAHDREPAVQWLCRRVPGHQVDLFPWRGHGALPDAALHLLFRGAQGPAGAAAERAGLLHGAVLLRHRQRHDDPSLGRAHQIGEADADRVRDRLSIPDGAGDGGGIARGRLVQRGRFAGHRARKRGGHDAAIQVVTARSIVLGRSSWCDPLGTILLGPVGETSW